jgi:hypothetical protein
MKKTGLGLPARSFGDILPGTLKKYTGPPYKPYNPFRHKKLAIDPSEKPKEIKLKYRWEEGWRRLYRRKDNRSGLVKDTMLNSNTGKMATCYMGAEACEDATRIAWEAVAVAMAATLEFRIRDIIADAAHAAMDVRMAMTRFLTHRVRELQDSLWEVRARVLQVEVDFFCGDACPDVNFDCFNRKLCMQDPLNFVGGKAQIVPEDLDLMKQISTCIMALFLGTKKLGWPMFHIQMDGHVHPTGKDMRCLVISFFRAAEVRRLCVEFGVPGNFLHVYGYGGTKPVGAKDANRRVEIELLRDLDGDGEVDSNDVAMAIGKARSLWKKIAKTADFAEAEGDPTFVGDPNKVMPITAYKP